MNSSRGSHLTRTLNLCLLAVALLLSGGACGSERTGHSETQTITVFAASSLTDVLDDIVEEFQLSHPGVRVKLNLAGSQELRLQLEHGAKGDVFLSADPAQMELAAEAGVIAEMPVVFATNRLVVIASRSAGPAPGFGEVLGQDLVSEERALAELKNLAAPGVSLALASPEVPAGAYAQEAIRRLDILFDAEMDHYADGVMANTATMEANVRSVAMKVALGEVDRGFVYATDATTPFVAEHTVQIPIPPEANPEATYLAGKIEQAQPSDLADRFIRYLLSQPGQRVMQSHGFGPPTGGGNGAAPRTPQSFPGTETPPEGK